MRRRVDVDNDTGAYSDISTGMTDRYALSSGALATSTGNQWGVFAGDAETVEQRI
jgi:hypothetical protein